MCNTEVSLFKDHLGGYIFQFTNGTNNFFSLQESIFVIKQSSTANQK